MIGLRDADSHQKDLDRTAGMVSSKAGGPVTYCLAAHSSSGEVDIERQILIQNCLMR